MNLGSNGGGSVAFVSKNLDTTSWQNFCINCTSSAHFASSLKQKWNGSKCTQTLRNATKHEFRVQWGGLGAFFAKTSDATLWHELLHYLHQFSPFCTEFTTVIKHSQMHQNTMKRTKTWGYGPMGWIGCVRCGKSRRDFVAQTLDLIAPINPVLHRVSCSYETIPNASKHYATHQNMSFGSNGVDWVRSLRKIPMWLHGTNFCINCTSSPRSAPSFMQLRNVNKCAQTL